MGYIIGFASREKYKRQGGDFMSTIEKQRMLEIEGIATRLLKDESFDDSPSVDIVSIVEKDGFDVRPKEMPISTTGCLFVNDDKKSKERTILVNTRFKNPENEKDVIFKKSRFITAHEYGHFILHKQPDQPLYAHRDSDKRDTPEEKEADYFARSILMPMRQFKTFDVVLNDFSKNDEEFKIEMLSRLFKVTRNKVKIRMGDLSVLG